MLFSSVIFVLFFLPLSLGLYYLTPRSLRNYVLLALGFLFYFWTEGQYLWVLVASLGANYGFGLLLQAQAKTTNLGARKATLRCAVAFNIDLLLFYKYLGFLPIKLTFSPVQARITLETSTCPWAFLSSPSKASPT